MKKILPGILRLSLSLISASILLNNLFFWYTRFRSEEELNCCLRAALIIATVLNGLDGLTSTLDAILTVNETKTRNTTTLCYVFEIDMTHMVHFCSFYITISTFMYVSLCGPVTLKRFIIQYL